jgi:hypothetical protein
MHIMPICPATIEMVEVLNNGVRPEIELDRSGNPTYFVFRPETDLHNEIITYNDYLDRFCGRTFWTNCEVDYYIK